MCECFQKNLSSRSLIIDGNYFVVYFPHFAVSHASVVKIMDISPKHTFMIPTSDTMQFIILFGVGRHVSSMCIKRDCSSEVLD